MDENMGEQIENLGVSLAGKIKDIIERQWGKRLG